MIGFDLLTASIGLAVTALAAALLLTSAPWVEEVSAPYFFAVVVQDVDRSVEWYRTTFGGEVKSDNTAEDGTWRIVDLRGEHVSVEIIRDDRGAPDPPEPAHFGIAKVGFSVPDVAALAERALTRLQKARAHRGALPRAAAAALLPGWQAGWILKTAAAHPTRVAGGDLHAPEYRRRGTLLLRSLTGRW